MSFMSVHRYFVFMLMVIVLWGCSSEEDPDAAIQGDTPQAMAALTPEETADAFMAAGEAGDKEGLETLLTEKAREGLNSGNSGFNVNESTYEEYTVGESTLTDEGSEVSVEVVQDGKTQSMKLKMREEDNAWRIYAVVVVLGEGMEISINFEKVSEMLSSVVEGIGESLKEGFDAAVQSSMMGGTDEEIALKKKRYEAIHALTMEEYQSRWLNEVDYSGKTAHAALTELATALGLTVHEAGFKELLAQKISVSVQSKSRLEAINLICEELGLYPQFPDLRSYSGGFGGAMVNALGEGLETLLVGENAAVEITGVNPDEKVEPEEEPAVNAILLVEEKRPFPVAFSGPFLIEINELEENAPLPTGRITLTVKTYGLDVGQLTLLEDMNGSLKFDGLLDTKGRSLIQEDVQYMSNGELTDTSYTDSYSLELLNLIREVTEIDTFSGTQKLVLPLEVHEVSFEGIQTGQTKIAGDITVKVKNAGKHTQFIITGPEAATNNMRVHFWPTDQDGNSLGITYNSADSWQAGQVQAAMNTPSAPHSVLIKLVSQSEALEYPFEIRGIPLTKYAQTPARIEELSFKDHEAPVSISLLKITERDPSFSKIDISISNHSNKDAKNASMYFKYLDSSGSELKELYHSVSGTFSSDGFASLAASHQTVEQETTAFNMPEGTQDIRMVIQQVNFSDGTFWKSE